MLVRLTSSTSGEMIMFAEHAHALFEWIGKECTAHGVFTTSQLSDAIARLRHGIELEKQHEKAREKAEHEARRAPEKRSAEADKPEDREEDEDEEKQTREVVLLGHRAQPLLQLMEWTLKENGFILWEAPSDF